MRVMKNVKAISKLSLILLLLTAGTIGAILSYMFVMGYYVSIGLRVPDETSIAITNATFPVQDATMFNVTILNPSFSPSNATITRIEVITEENDVHVTNILRPATPYNMKPGSIENFTCLWNWSNYTNREVRINVLLAEGSGATFQTRTPPMRLIIIDARFNATESTAYFNLTVHNDQSSATYVNVTEITLTAETVEEITPYPSLPYTLHPNTSVTYKCPWNWTYYRNKTVTIVVRTLQHYEARCIQVTPMPVTLTITKALFNETDTNHFNITVQNSELSPTHANITEITVTMENGTTREINETVPLLPRILLPGSSEEIRCTWNWTLYRSKNATINVHQLEGYPATYNQTTPPLVILEIKEAGFSLTDPNYFNFTVESSELSSMDVNVTKITVTPEIAQEIIIEDVTPALPYKLPPSSIVTFICEWNGTDYLGKNVTITMYTLQGYNASCILVMPPWVNLSVTEVLFNATDTTHFNVTVINHELSPISVNVTQITVTMEDGATQIIANVTPSLPHTLHPSDSITFTCSWDWTNYRSKNVIITVYTLEGYRAYYTRATPTCVNLTITWSLFNVTDVPYFNVTVQSSVPSSIDVNIIRITVNMTTAGNETIILDMTPPYKLSIGSSVTFMCHWDWTTYQGQNVTIVITVYTLEGYKAETLVPIP